MAHESLKENLSPEYDRLQTTVEKGTTDQLKACLKSIAFSKKALDEAFMFGVLAGAHVDKLIVLLESGAGFKGMDIALIAHVAMNDLDAIRKLVATGAPASMFNQAAQLAVSQENIALIQYFIDQQIDLDADDGELLYRACDKGSLPIVRCLVEAGADVNANSGRALIPAVQSALKTQSMELVRSLIDEFRISVDTFGRHCLHLSSEIDTPFSTELMGYLIERGVSPAFIPRAEAFVDRKVVESEFRRNDAVSACILRRRV